VKEQASYPIQGVMAGTQPEFTPQTARRVGGIPHGRGKIPARNMEESGVVLATYGRGTSRSG